MILLNKILPLTLWGLLVKIVVYIIVYGGLLYFYGCNKLEKQDLQNAVQIVFKSGVKRGKE